LHPRENNKKHTGHEDQESIINVSVAKLYFPKPWASVQKTEHKDLGPILGNAK
jgi:flagellar motor switch protein FliG